MEWFSWISCHAECASPLSYQGCFQWQTCLFAVKLVKETFDFSLYLPFTFWCFLEPTRELHFLAHCLAFLLASLFQTSIKEHTQYKRHFHFNGQRISNVFAWTLCKMFFARGKCVLYRGVLHGGDLHRELFAQGEDLQGRVGMGVFLQGGFWMRRLNRVFFFYMRQFCMGWERFAQGMLPATAGKFR